MTVAVVALGCGNPNRASLAARTQQAPPAASPQPSDAGPFVPSVYEPAVVTDDPSPAFVAAAFGDCLSEISSYEVTTQVDPVCVASGFCFEHPLPQGNDLDRVFALGSSSWFSVSLQSPLRDGGSPPMLGNVRPRALRFDGNRWTAPDVPLAPLLLVTADDALWGGAGAAYLDGYEVGTLGRWDGQSLTVVKLDGLGPLELSGTGPGDVWAIASTHNAFFGVERWTGSGWSARGYIDGKRYVSLSARGPSDAWIIGTDPSTAFGHPYRYDGTDWYKEDPGFLAGIARTRAADDSWVFGWSDAAHFDGVGWTRHATALDGSSSGPLASPRLRDAWIGAPDDVWAVGTGGALVHFDGARFTATDLDVRNDLTGVSGSAWNDVWAVGAAANVLHFDGTRWSVIESGEGMDLRDVWGTGDDDVWAVGQRVVHGDSAGWRGTAESPHLLRAVHGAGPRDVWAVGDGGLALHFDGGCWRPTPVPLSFGNALDLTGVWAAAPNSVFAAGTGRQPDHSVVAVYLHWDGAGWSRLHERATSSARVRGTSPDDVWFGPLHFDGTTFSWVPLPTATIAPKARGDVLVFGGGHVWRWDGQAVIEAAQGQAWGREDVAALDGDGAWLAADSGDLGHYDGSTFSWVATPSWKPLRSVWVSPGGRVIAVGDDGVVVAR
jgi:hypothetical protein